MNDLSNAHRWLKCLGWTLASTFCHLTLISCTWKASQPWKMWKNVEWMGFSLDLAEKAMTTHSSTLAWKIPWTEEPGGLQSMGSRRVRHLLSDFTFTFHFHALEKEMASHSSILAWRIPGTVEPGGLLSMGSHRVRHDWSNLAAATAGVGKYSPWAKSDPLHFHQVLLAHSHTLQLSCTIVVEQSWVVACKV